MNFALDLLGTEVTSDKVSSDGYEPRNLLRQGGMLWNRPQGFLAERFIKPPVTLTFKLPCPVHLKSILIDPKVGTQRSSVIEIYSAADFNVRRAAAASAGPAESRVGEARSSSEPVLKKIGFIRCLEPGQICFFNPRFSVHHPPAGDPTPAACPHRSQLHHHQAPMLVAVDWLAVRIVGTANSSVAAIGKLEIWGLPARSCPAQLRQSITQKYASIMGSAVCSGNSVNLPQTHSKSKSSTHNTQTPHGNKVNHKQNESSQNSSATKVSNGHASTSPENAGTVQIPSEFLDALTFEIMSMPMLLPSGQCVDLSTMDKFAEVEANYGRHPSDPFTGLNFTANRKPVVNSALKVRIDHFTAKHADDPSFHCLPRTVGHGSQPPDSADVSDGHLTGGDQSSKDRNSVQRSLKRPAEDRRQFIPQTLPQPSVSGAASDSSRSTSTSARKRLKKEAGACDDQSGARNHPGDTERQTSQSVEDPRYQSHEERLRSSLRNSLASVLGHLPVFSSSVSQHRPPSSSETHPSEEHCSKCQTVLKHSDSVFTGREPVVVYKLPCLHLVCRVCVVNDGSSQSTSNITCCVCHRQFPRSELRRTHV